jgi:hypothetical protein
MIIAEIKQNLFTLSPSATNHSHFSIIAEKRRFVQLFSGFRGYFLSVDVADTILGEFCHGNTW